VETIKTTASLGTRLRASQIPDPGAHLFHKTLQMRPPISAPLRNPHKQKSLPPHE